MGLNQQRRDSSALEEQQRERLNHCSAFILHGQTSVLKPREWEHQKDRIQIRYLRIWGEKELLPWCKCEDDVREEASATMIFNL